MDPAAAARYAGVAGVEPSRLRFRTGRESDLAFDEAGGRVYRFPRHPRAAADLPRQAALLGALPALGVPIPRVVASDLTAPPGRAYVATRLLPGRPLAYAAVEALDRDGRRRLAGDLARLLASLRRSGKAAGLAGLLAPARDWRWWAGVEERASRALLHLLPPESRTRAQAELAAAVAAAQEAPAEPALTHGRLGGENVLIDPGSGRLTGILDWSEAAPGDPALDLAALSRDLNGEVLEHLFGAAPVLLGDVRRAHAYAATFDLQEALAGFEAGDLAAVAAGLDTYR